MGSLPAVSERIIYPSARRDTSVVDNYHGVVVGDPYRWLEDPESDETKEFVKAEVALSEGVLAAACDLRGRLRTRITELIDHPRHFVPSKRAGKYFYLSNSGLQAQSVLYVQEGEADGRAEVLLDPNELSSDGTVALGVYSVSQDGRYLAYGLSSGGSDWVNIRVMLVQEKVVMMDTLLWIKFSCISWTHDGKGFFYSRFPAPSNCGDAGTETNINLYHQVYYHFLGTDQSEDILCWRDSEHPKYIFEAQVTDDGKYCLLYIEEGCDTVNKLYYCDLTSLPEGLKGFKSKGMLPFIKLVDSFDACYTYVANDNTKFTFVTNKEAPKNKVVCVDVKDPNVWTDVLEESEKDVLRIVRAINRDQMMVCYMNDVKHTLQLRDLESGRMLHQLPLDIGSVCGVTGRRYDTEVLVGFTNFLTPAIIFKCDLSMEVPKMKIFKEISLPGFDREDFEVTQVFISSKDGTKVPMFIFAKRNTPMDGSNPTLLYGYGGFNVSLTPAFNVNRIVLARHLGVVFCIANIRGGGEYGKEWHKSGTLSKKQNCFDDFISAAEYLVSSGYTNPRKLCIEGGSNGGLLVAACMNQRPDLFGCVLSHVGVMDMLRFHKFTIGHAWTTDFGCSDKEEEFHWLIKYSPLHNVKKPWEEHTALPLGNCQYPSTMLLTADHDDRVVPLHSLKMLATMQYVLCTSVNNSLQTNPIIARIDSKAGHGCGQSTQKMINEAADRYGFMAKIMELCWIV